MTTEIITITYEIYHHYNWNNGSPIGDPARVATVNNTDHTGKEIIDCLRDMGKLYIGASYIGCLITDIKTTPHKPEA